MGLFPESQCRTVVAAGAYLAFKPTNCRALSIGHDFPFAMQILYLKKFHLAITAFYKDLEHCVCHHTFIVRYHEGYGASPLPTSGSRYGLGRERRKK